MSSLNSISFSEFQTLTETQCPLPPRKYKYINSENERCSLKTTAWFYQDKFWIKEPNTFNIYPAILPQKETKKFKLRVLQMRTVDEYLSGFNLTSSVDIYNMLQHSINRDALTPRTKGSIGANDKYTNATLYAKKFNPRWRERIGFFTVVFRAALNAYFIGTNFITIGSVPSQYAIFVIIVVCIEALLWLIAFCRTMYNLYSLLKRMCTGSTTHFQVKNIPENLRQLGSLSVMRYLPSGEGMSMLKKRWKEWFLEKKASFKFDVSNSHKFKYFVMLRWFILSVLDVIGPFVAVFSLFFKMAQLNFQFDALFTFEWYEILSYFGFVNQIAGIRKIRKIEIDALQHFVFSGSDIKLSEEEALLLDVWWNFTIVSCIANICDEFRFPVFDSIIFWYGLNVRRIQLLFKDHKGMEGKQFIQKGGKRMKIDINAYDEQVQKQVDKNKLLDEHLELNQVKVVARSTSPTDESIIVDVDTNKNHNYIGVPIDENEEENEKKQEEQQREEEKQQEEEQKNKDDS